MREEEVAVVVWSTGNVQHLNQGEVRGKHLRTVLALFLQSIIFAPQAALDHTMYIKVVHKQVSYNAACNFVEFTSIIVSR